MDTYPHIQDLIDDFAFLDDWEDRYMHIIEMGKALAPLNENEKSPQNKVNGCVSQVWLVSERNGEQLTFRGDSDAHIVKGLIAVALKIFSGREASEIKKIDAIDVMQQLGLSEHLSVQRANGLRSMIGRIQAFADGAL